MCDSILSVTRCDPNVLAAEHGRHGTHLVANIEIAVVCTIVVSGSSVGGGGVGVDGGGDGGGDIDGDGGGVGDDNDINDNQ